MSRRAGVIAVGLAAVLFLLTPPVEAAVFRGIQEIIAGVFQLPVSIIAGTFTGPPVVGTVLGAVNGVTGGLGLVAHGVLELAASAFHVAKTVGPLVLPFVL